MRGSRTLFWSRWPRSNIQQVSPSQTWFLWFWESFLCFSFTIFLFSSPCAFVSFYFLSFALSVSHLPFLIFYLSLSLSSSLQSALACTIMVWIPPQRTWTPFCGLLTGVGNPGNNEKEPKTSHFKDPQEISRDPKIGMATEPLACHAYNWLLFRLIRQAGHLSATCTRPWASRLFCWVKAFLISCLLPWVPEHVFGPLTLFWLETLQKAIFHFKFLTHPTHPSQRNQRSGS